MSPSEIDLLCAVIIMLVIMPLGLIGSAFLAHEIDIRIGQ